MVLFWTKCIRSAYWCFRTDAFELDDLFFARALRASHYSCKSGQLRHSAGVWCWKWGRSSAGLLLVLPFKLHWSLSQAAKTPEDKGCTIVECFRCLSPSIGKPLPPASKPLCMWTCLNILCATLRMFVFCYSLHNLTLKLEKTVGLKDGVSRSWGTPLKNMFGWGNI